MDELDMLKGIAEFAPLIESLSKAGVSIISKFAEEYWDPKWAEKQAVYHSKYYNILIKNSVPESIASVLTVGLANVPKEVAKQMMEATSQISQTANKIKTDREKEKKDKE